MIKISSLKVNTERKDLVKETARFLKCGEKRIKSVEILKKSLDCRKRGNPFFVYTLKVSAERESEFLKLKNVEKFEENRYEFDYTPLRREKTLIVGLGPAGLFCGLMLARCGLNPVIIERGEDVDKRYESVKKFFETGELNENSNVQFGEGGAGTFSDGKLTCGLNSRKIPFVINEFVKHGAPDEIAYLSKPHIGTDCLHNTVKKIREEIVSLGGEVRFNHKLTDMIINNNRVEGAVIEAFGKTYEEKCDNIVLATGHSARDIYEMVISKGIRTEKKPFSVGVRIEHKREYINMLRYGSKELCESLPAADYKLACHKDKRGAYTFCMCPGGYVVASSSEKGQVVTNGMSNFKRDAENSNAAILVSVSPEDIKGSQTDAIKFQEKLEKAAYELGGGNFFAPVQKAGDFLKGVKSTGKGEVTPSYRPGVKWCDLNEILPDFVADMLKFAICDFDRKIKGFNFPDAVLTGIETRSSAPLRIVRGKDFQSVVKGIYPIGEGAGYAGGIISSALDGINAAEVIKGEI